MIAGDYGLAKQMAMRLLLDMAAAAGATELIPVESAHLSGVSPLTGGLGLRLFLAKLAEDPKAKVAIPTTLNSAGCDVEQFEAMRITVPDFLDHSQQIVDLYSRIGVKATQSCIPYEWEGVITSGIAAWAESNAISFGNSYCGLVTNRESGLSALASALTGYTPKYGLLLEENRNPNIAVIVKASLADPTDFSILGDWIGKQRRPNWKLPYGPIPLIKGLPSSLDHEQRKALTSAAANYGSPLLYIEGISEVPPIKDFRATLEFTSQHLEQRYSELKPREPISLITIGCPQASVGEIKATAELLKGKRVSASPEDSLGLPPLWIFTSAANKSIAEHTGLAEIIKESGALLLQNTCPEVVPYDQHWVQHILTNSMKAEHYIKSGLNGIPTSVMPLADCIAAATGELIIDQTPFGVERESDHVPKTIAPVPESSGKTEISISQSNQRGQTSKPLFESTGHGLPSQEDFRIEGEVFVTDAPITLLGFVNRETGVIEEPGHPADGQSMAGKIAIFPKGTGSTVAPYVLLELHYRGKAPIAIINTEIDQQSAPACSLEGIPYAYNFDDDIIDEIQTGDIVEFRRSGEEVLLRVISRHAP
jgi:predicted aconitase/predicted aconitase with swiveling domain